MIEIKKFQEIGSDQLTCSYLKDAVAKLSTEGGKYQCFSVNFDNFHDAFISHSSIPAHTNNDIEIVWQPDSKYVELVWEEEAAWTYAESPEDALERFLGINGKEISEGKPLWEK